MHTWNGEGCTINYNLDLSGNLIITGRNPDSISNNTLTIEVPAKEMLSFIGVCLREQKIDELESITGLEYLNSLGIKINLRKEE